MAPTVVGGRIKFSKMEKCNSGALLEGNGTYTASSTDLIIVSSFSFCCMLLLLGHILRVKVCSPHITSLTGSPLG